MYPTFNMNSKFGEEVWLQTKEYIKTIFKLTFDENLIQFI